MVNTLQGLRVVVILLVVAVASAACGSTPPTATAPAGGSEPSVRAPSPSAPIGPSGGTPTVGDDLDQLIADAVANSSPVGLSTTERAIRDTIDEQVGLTAAIGPELHDWLQEQRSAAAIAALEARGIDPESLGPTGISSEPVASTDLGLTALTGLGWIGTALVISGLVQNGAGSLGQGSNADPGPPSTVTGQMTIGDELLTTTMTLTTQISVSGSMVIADADAVESSSVSSVSSGAAIGTATSHNHVHVEANMCPDANGGVAVVVTSDWSDDASGMPGGGSFSMQSTFDVQATVNDSAFLASSATNSNSTFQGTSGGTTQSGSATTSWSQTMGPSGSSAGGSIGPTTGSMTGGYTPQQAFATHGLSSILPMMISDQVLQEAQKAWRGGKCVEITATEQSRKVRPNEVVPFTAQPRHKIEGTNLAKPVVASFAGKRSVDPANTPVDAPADFTFKASPVAGQWGRVTLTTTSNRGIGTLDITFEVEAQGWFIDEQFTNAAGATGKHLGYKCGSDPGGRWKVAGKYEFLGFTGRQLWTIDLDASPTSDGQQFFYEGSYKYADDSKGPYGVKQHTRVSGTVRATIDDTDGSVRMVLTEKARRQWAEAPGGGFGTGPGTPQPAGGFVWTADAGC